MSIQIKGLLLGLAAALGSLGLVFGLSPAFRPKTNGTAAAVLQGEAARGDRLFDQSCAHCHGEDARGDEGPDLHGLIKSDVRITKIIKGGIKGEMPSFAKKFNDSDVHALIAYLRTLK